MRIRHTGMSFLPPGRIRAAAASSVSVPGHIRQRRGGARDGDRNAPSGGSPCGYEPGSGHHDRADRDRASRDRARHKRTTFVTVTSTGRGALC